jgi:methylase of polypeptide subunit release factors
MVTMYDPILGYASMTLLRRAVEGYTVDAVQELLGPVGRAAHQRGDLAGVARALPDDEPLATLVRLFLLGLPVSATAARTALWPLDLGAAAPLLDTDGDQVRARLELRPYATDSAGPWWVLSDFGSDVRPGPLASDHVLGIGGASLTLAQATPRRPVERALDVGTGSGVQALHADTHAGSVVATDVSERALRLAATSAWLSGQTWDLRRGSLLEPVAGEQFDLIVANPPFVVSPGFDRTSDGFDYRDSGLAGDAASATLVGGIPSLLTADGTASLLANWIIPADGDWTGRVESWFPDVGCDAWVWQREVVEPGAYVTMWLRDAGETPGTPRWVERYDRWCDWFAANEVAALGMGLITIWRGTGTSARVHCEDVPQAVEQPAGAHLWGWIERRRWLAAHDDAALRAARLRHADGLVLTRHDSLGGQGWTEAFTQLRQSAGMRWELEADEAISGLVAACDGDTPLGVVLDVLAAVTGAAEDDVAGAALPVVRDLIARGFLEVP